MRHLGGFKRLVFAASLGLFAARAVEKASGQVATWAAPVNGFFDTPSNWDPAGVPTANDTLVFAEAGDYAIGLTGAHGAANLTVANGADIDFNVAGASTDTRLLRLTGDASIDEARLRLLGNTSGPRLNLVLDGDIDLSGGSNALQVEDNAALLNRSTVINVNGTIPVTGDLARWSMSDDLSVRGSGLLSVTRGGTVAVQRDLTTGGTDPADNTDGFLSVIGVGDDGQPTTLEVGDDLLLGNYGVSRLTVQDGGFVDVTDRVQLGIGAGSSGRILVEGVDAAGNPSVLNTGLMTLGRGGNGDLLVESGGVVRSDSATVGSDSEADAVVIGGELPAIWEIAGGLRVGSFGLGRVEISRGGRLTTRDTFLGLGTTRSGFLQFLGAEPEDLVTVWENHDSVYVGGNESTPFGSASLLVSGNTDADIGGTLRIWGDGEVQIRFGARLAVDTIDHTHGGEFSLISEAILHVNRFEGDLINPSATLAPGADGSAGSTLVTGDYTQESDALLAIGVGGTSPGGTHDLVTIAGDADLDGVLELSLIDGFIPDGSEAFTVFAASSLIGFFDNVSTGQRLDTTDGLGSFVVNYGIGSAFDESRIVLSDFEPSGLLPGDYNDDGLVDAADYAVWRDSLNAPAGTLPNDIAGGVIGPAQYETWRANYGLTAAPATAIPEPGTLACLVAGALSTSRRHRRLAARYR